MALGDEFVDDDVQHRAGREREAEREQRGGYA
jgi:hypothetical protein